MYLAYKTEIMKKKNEFYYRSINIYIYILLLIQSYSSLREMLLQTMLLKKKKEKKSISSNVYTGVNQSILLIGILVYRVS